jgi:hypothetical protein
MAICCHLEDLAAPYVEKFKNQTDGKIQNFAI